MKKLYTILFIMVSSLVVLHAQQTITGTVVDPEGETLIGANVIGVGTTVGTITDIDGRFELELPEETTQVEVSFTGYATRKIDINNQSELAIVLSEGVQLQDVVVTAAGIERQRKDLGYSVTTISQDEVTIARETNVVNSLSGKTSGVQITNQSGNLGGSSKILIRGVNSLSGNNNPLWVVDGVPIYDSNISTGSRISGGFDTGNRAQDINPDDIETINILKGAAATALYGSRAANGAIVITTKRGKKGANANITFNSSLRFDNPLRLPDFQNEHAQGSYGKYRPDFLNGWGPRIEGQTVTNFRDEEEVLTAQPDNVRDFYETGKTYINNVALSGGTDNSDFRISLTALNQTGIFPGSKLDRYTTSFNAGMKFAQNVSSRFGINYVRTTSEGRVAQGSNNPNVLSSLINGFPRTVDVDQLRDYKEETPSGATQINTLGEMTNNPYWIAFENRFDTEVDRLYGNFELKYEPVLWLDFISRVGYDILSDDRFRSNRKGTLNRINGDFTEDRLQQRQLDLNLMAIANKDLTDDIFLKAIVGYNVNQRVFERLTVNANQLTVDQLFSYGNTDVNNPVNDFSERRLYGVYGDLTLSYKDWLNLNVTGRNDWSSTLPKVNNSYFYPSTSLAFIFTDAFDMNDKVLSYGKFRISYARVGNDTGPYQLAFNYFPQTDVFGQFGTGTTFPFNGTLAFSGPGTVPPGDALRPESVRSFEIGTELQFWQGLIGLDATYYQVNTTDQILAIPVPESTGFGFVRRNIGETSNKGVELELSVNPFRTGDFRWSSLFTFTSNKFIVEELAEGVDRLIVNSGFSSVQVVATPGEEYGLHVNRFRRAESDETKILVDPETGLRQSGENGRMGDLFPDYIMGLSNNFGYKNLSLSFTLDMRVGGLMYSETVQNLRNNGLAIETLENRDGAYIDREAYIEMEDGSLVENNIPVSAQDFWTQYTDANIGEGGVFDASFLKVREIGLSYKFNNALLSGVPMSTISIGIEARNPFLLWSKIPHIDPETNLFGSANDGAGVEWNSPPTARSIGVNFRMTF